MSVICVPLLPVVPSSLFSRLAVALQCKHRMTVISFLFLSINPLFRHLADAFIQSVTQRLCPTDIAGIGGRQCHAYGGLQVDKGPFCFAYLSTIQNYFALFRIYLL